ncbi:MAG: glycine zipper 2TM domain-containing protein [Hylemonella sp.]|uniref:glycine zipper 2TM domain-containing protein n=1 Tax=Hylemonella sp. TaxID=2066020 RepID=UPI0022CCCD23|nr:glycine zipper 2TM domain-containing protein [Hylemonella sp.]MCZ8252770.1 glycine zipper 2TM domain-containing protein [Hylemonella sp.]
MSELTSSGAVVAGTKGLWVAVGVLGAAVLGLGGALVYTQRTPAPEVSIAPPVAVPAEPAATPVVEAKPVAAAPVAKPRPAVVKKAAADPVPTAVVTPAPASAPAIVAPAPVCLDCATVTAVTPVEREVPTGGTGAVAGGVLGAIVGNQIGRGSGRDVATVIGAIGGGIAGNQIEKKMKKVLAWQVDLRMDDGSRRSFELDRPLTVGERVRYDGAAVQPLPAHPG